MADLPQKTVTGDRSDADHMDCDPPPPPPPATVKNAEDQVEDMEGVENAEGKGGAGQNLTPGESVGPETSTETNKDELAEKGNDVNENSRGGVNEGLKGGEEAHNEVGGTPAMNKGNPQSTEEDDAYWKKKAAETRDIEEDDDPKNIGCVERIRQWVSSEKKEHRDVEEDQVSFLL